MANLFGKLLPRSTQATRVYGAQSRLPAAGGFMPAAGQSAMATRIGGAPRPGVDAARAASTLLSRQRYGLSAGDDVASPWSSTITNMGPQPSKPGPSPAGEALSGGNAMMKLARPGLMQSMLRGRIGR